MIRASARLLRLLTLLQSRSAWTGEELAERLDVTRRTLRRDVDRLRRLDYPVNATSGVAGGYQLAPGGSLPPIMLDEEEATAVFLGLHVARGTGISEVGTAGMRALAKVERALPSRLQRSLRTLENAVIGLAARARPLSLAHVTTLAAACGERRITKLTYAARNGARTVRLVEPISLVRVGALFYVVAWDIAKEDWRVFRLDRVEEVEAQERTFAARPSPDGDLAGFVTRSLSTSPHPHRAKVLIDAPLAAVRPRVGAFDASFEPAPDGRCTMELGAPTLDVLVARILWLGLDFEIVDAPPELRRHMQAVAARLRRASAATASKHHRAASASPGGPRASRTRARSRW